MSELNSLNDLDTTDRVFLFSPFYTKEVAQDVQQLIDKDIDFVLVCNRPKQEDFPEHLMHFVNLSTPVRLYILRIMIKLYNLIQWRLITFTMIYIHK